MWIAVWYVGRSYQQVPRKTFKKQRLAVAESGERLSVRDAEVGGTRACIATEVYRMCKRTKAEK